MNCNALKGAATHHEILREIWRRIKQRVQIASSIELLLHSRQGAQATAIADRPESHGDILLVLPDELLFVDVLVVHAAASTYMHVAQMEEARAGTSEAGANRVLLSQRLCRLAFD